MRKKVLVILLCTIFVLSAIVLIKKSNNDLPDVENEVPSTQNTYCNSLGYKNVITNINYPDTRDSNYMFSYNFQSLVEEQVEYLKMHNLYTIDNPLMISDMYKMDINSMYLFFKTFQVGYIKYSIRDQIQIHDYSSYYRLTTSHEIPILGLIINDVNLIDVQFYDSSDSLIIDTTYCFELGNRQEDTFRLDVVEKHDDKISDGLFVMNTIAKNWSRSNLRMFDNNGNVRYTSVFSQLVAIVKRNGANLQVVANTHEDKLLIFEVNQFGKLIKLFKTSEYSHHHDYTQIGVDGKDKLLILVDRYNESGEMLDESDLVMILDYETFNIDKIIDLKDNFTGYDYTKNGNDWAHINSIDYSYEFDEMYLSFRETSSIVTIGNIFPKSISADMDEKLVSIVDGNIAFEKISSLSVKTMSQVGNVHKLGGQHSATFKYIDQNTFQILLFNNYTSIGSSGLDFSNVLDIGESLYSGTNSLIQVLEVDRVNFTYKEVKTINVEYSSIMSNVYEYEGNYVSSSAFHHKKDNMSSVINEIDQNTSERVANFKISE